MALLGNLTGSAPFFQDAVGFYNNVATQSARFDDGSSAYLTKTFGSDGTGSGATCTVSCWVKRTTISNSDQWFFTAGSSSPAWILGFRTNDNLAFGDDDGNPFVTVTNRVFRDTSAWYHIVLRVKTSESANADKYKIYVNGELQATTFSGTAADTLLGANVVHNIGRYPTGSVYFDGYMAEVNFVDGLALDASYFGETKNGVWIPKEPDVSEYGTNGFRFKFDQVGVGTASTSTIGADTSGKTNHFTSSGIVASDCNMPDSPENNFCTLNINARGTTNVSLSKGNLKFVKSGANFGNVLSTMPLFSGKWYFEGVCLNNDLAQVGVQEITNNIYQNSGDFGANTDLGMWDSRGFFYDEGTAGGSVPTYTTGDIIGIAFDVEAGKIWFAKNGTYLFSGDPANGTNQSTGSTNNLSSIGVTPAGNGEGGGGHTLNFGQDSSFAGAKTAQGNTDENGIGDFYYSPPSGFLALCTANLPEPTISPNADTQADDYFNTVLKSMSTNNEEAITGVGFQPDWVWGKSRNNAYNHQLYDSNRGVTKYLESNTTAQETTNANSLKSFDTDGMTVGSGATFAPYSNGNNVVFWCWKANGGTTASNTDGSITSTVQANTDAGFSIVTYTSNNIAGATVGHGLGKVPAVLITKNRESARNWGVYHHKVASDPETDALFLNLGNSLGDNPAYWNDTAPTNTVFTVGTGGGETNYPASQGYVAYCFAEIEGYSKFGSYIGNGVTSGDGTFVFLGLRPAWIMIKNISASADWVIVDSVRSTFNEVDDILAPDNSGSESDFGTTNRNIDFLSNGFKIRSTSAGGTTALNTSGSTYIYMAFGETFKYANAR